MGNLEDRLSSFIASYSKDKDALREKILYLESLVEKQRDTSSSSRPTPHIRSPAAQSQIRTSISVTHLKTPANHYSQCSTTVTNRCKTTQLSLSVENLEYNQEECEQSYLPVGMGKISETDSEVTPSQQSSQTVFSIVPHDDPDT